MQSRCANPGNVQIRMINLQGTIDVGKVKNEKVKKQKSKVVLPRELHLLGQSFFNATITFFSHVTGEDGISYVICKFQCKGCGKMIKPSILTSAKKKDEFVWKFQTGKYFILPSDIYVRNHLPSDATINVTLATFLYSYFRQKYHNFFLSLPKEFLT